MGRRISHQFEGGQWYKGLVLGADGVDGSDCNYEIANENEKDTTLDMDARLFE